jgi:hypothetical protein
MERAAARVEGRHSRYRALEPAGSLIFTISYDNSSTDRFLRPLS